MAFDEYKGAMFSTKWKTSERKYGYTVDKDVKIPMGDGVKLSSNIWKPDAGGKFPAILGFHCYHADGQTGPIKPAAISTAQWRHPGQERTNASLEAGDPVFFAPQNVDFRGTQCVRYDQKSVTMEPIQLHVGQ